MHLEFSLATVGMLLLGLLILSLVIFFVYKNYLKKSQSQDLHSKYDDGTAAGFLKGRNKYPEVDVLRNSGPFLGFGLVSALALSLLAFNYTEYETIEYGDDLVLDIVEDVEEEEIAPRSVPTRKTPPPPPPPPPPPIIEEVDDDEILEEEPIIEDQEIEKDIEIDLNPDVTEVSASGPPMEVKKAEPKKEKPKPKPIIEEEPVVPEIFERAEQMPRFPGCENEPGDNKAKEKCAKKKMMKYIYKKLKYPTIAKENGVQGNAVIRFVVDEKGMIKDVKILRNPGAGTGESAQKVVLSMNKMKQKWTPGMQGGKNVSVRYTLPVRFKLE